MGSYPAVSPLPAGPLTRAAPAVSFLWHFPRGYPHRALPGILLCGARTFLPPDHFRATAGDHPSGVDAGQCAPWSAPTQRADSRSTAMAPSTRREAAAPFGMPWLCLVTTLASTSCSSFLTLHAPNVVPSVAREPTRIDLNPIDMRGTVIDDIAPPGPAVVLTAAMRQELAGRSLSGGDPGGYAVRCALNGFAIQSERRRSSRACSCSLCTSMRPAKRGAARTTSCWAGRTPPQRKGLRRGQQRPWQQPRRHATPGRSRLFGMPCADGKQSRAPGARPLRRAERPRVPRRERAARGLGLDDTPWGAATSRRTPMR